MYIFLLILERYLTCEYTLTSMVCGASIRRSFPDVSLCIYPQWEASTLDKSHSNSLLIAIGNIYILARNQCKMPVTLFPMQCMCYMNIHEHTWTAPGYRQNSTCKASAKHLAAVKTSALASPRIHCQTGQITSGSPLWRDLTKVPGLTWPGRESNCTLNLPFLNLQYVI